MNSYALVSGLPSSTSPPSIFEGFKKGMHADGNSYLEVWAAPACDPVADPCLLIQNSTEQGVFVSGASADISSAVIQNNPKGIWAEDGASLVITNTEVVTNAAQGIVLTHSSHATIQTATEVSGNSQGVVAANGSTVRFQGTGIILGNTTNDYACDASSRITGTSYVPWATASCADTDLDPFPLP